MPHPDGSQTTAEKIATLLSPLHKSVKPEEIGAHPVDEAGNPIGSISERLHRIADRARILNALRKQAVLNAEDMKLAKRLGINVGPDPKDQNQFDL